MDGGEVPQSAVYPHDQCTHIVVHIPVPLGERAVRIAFDTLTIDVNGTQHS